MPRTALNYLPCGESRSTYYRTRTYLNRGASGSLQSGGSAKQRHAGVYKGEGK